MNKEEILEKSRRENKNRDEMEKAAFSKAGQMACGVGGIVCGLLILLDAIFSDGPNFGPWAVYLSMAGTMLLTKYFTLKKKHELIFGILELVLALIFLIMHALRLIR